MTTLESVFGEHLPALLAKAKPSRSLVGFAVTSGPDQGYWVVSLAEKKCRRGTEKDKPDVVVEGQGALLAAFFAGALDVKKAVEQGALRIEGDAKALASLAAALK